MKKMEIKWYVTSKLGSKISKSKLINNKAVLKKLQLELNMINVEDILEQLNSMGFEIITKKAPTVNLEPIKISYTEPKTVKITEDIKKDLIYKNYMENAYNNRDKKLKRYYEEKRIKKIKNGISKPHRKDITVEK